MITSRLVDRPLNNACPGRGASAAQAHNRAWHYLIVAALMALAIGLRLDHYLGDRSLWLDEALLVENLLERGFWALLQPLDKAQIAPVAFLWIEKGLIELWGSSEYVLRLFPLIAGIASVLMIYVLAVRVAGRHVALIALALFAIAEPAIYYAAEAKQYSSDMAVALGLYLVTVLVVREASWRAFGVLAFAGVVAVWVSHPSAFVLAGVGLSLGVWYLVKGDLAKVAATAVMASLWLASFALAFFITGSSDSDVVALMQDSAWTGAFGPAPGSLQSLKWYVDKLLSLAGGPLNYDGIGVFVFVVGVLGLWQNRRLWLFLLTAPVLVTLAVSMARLYPFSGRLLLFLLPAIVIVIACGIERTRQILWPRYRLLWVALVGLLVLYPAMNAVKQFTVATPYEREDMKDVLEYISHADRSYDALYVYASARSAFRYYRSRYDLADDVIQGRERRGQWQSYTAKLDAVTQKDRVWVIFSHVGNGEIKDYLVHRLDAEGTRLDMVQAQGASAYLYRFAAGRQGDASEKMSIPLPSYARASLSP